jgi:N-methylhydantoinase A
MRNLADRCLAGIGSLRRNGDLNDTVITEFLNLRYQGQSYELSIPYEKNFQELFHRLHEQNFGYRLDDTPLELVSIQCSITVRRQKPLLPRQKEAELKKLRPQQQQPVYFERIPLKVPVFNRIDLASGSNFEGPALIADNYTTIILPESFSLEVDELHNIIISGRLS